jgi:antitoxin component HigA of HigAB toxin-antitoxin module
VTRDPIETVLSHLENEELTQTAFAEELGVRQDYLSRVLSKKRRPNLELIQKLRERLKIDPSAWVHNKRPGRRAA